MAGSDVAVRRATIDDAGGIAVVHVATWRATYRGLVPQSLLDDLSVEARTATWQRILRDDSGSTLIAIAQAAEEQVVGFVSVGPSRDTDPDRAPSELFGIYLHPDYWGRGAGKHLLDCGLAELPPTETTLWVLGSNDRARRFYERQGWTLDGATKDEDRGEVVLSEVRYRRRWLCP